MTQPNLVLRKRLYYRTANRCYSTVPTKTKMTSYSSRRQLSTNLWLCESIFTQFRRLPPLCTIKQTENSHSFLPAHPFRYNRLSCTQR